MLQNRQEFTQLVERTLQEDVLVKNVLLKKLTDLYQSF